jgi:hypothetical protein
VVADSRKISGFANQGLLKILKCSGGEVDDSLAWKGPLALTAMRGRIATQSTAREVLWKRLILFRGSFWSEWVHPLASV